MGEEVTNELKLAKFKTKNLRKSIEKLNSDASSILFFTLQWSDLEEHYEKLQKVLEEKALKIGLLQKEVETTKKVLDENIASKERVFSYLEEQLRECNEQLDVKTKQLDLAERWLQESFLELKSKKNVVACLTKSIQDCSSELELKKEELCSVKRSVEESCSERQRIEGELAFNRKEFEVCCHDMNVKEEQLRSVMKLIEEHQEELRSKELELKMVKEKLDEFSVQIPEKKSQMDELQSSLEVRLKELELTEKHLDSKRVLVKACEDDINSKTKKLEQLKELTSNCSVQLDLKNKELVRSQELAEEKASEIKEKEQHVGSLESLIEEYSEELAKKEKEYELINKSITTCSAELKSKRQELEAVNNSITYRSEELDSARKELHEIQQEARKVGKQLRSKKEEIASVETALRRYNLDLEKGRRESNDLRNCLTKQKKLLKLTKASSEECDQELKVKKQLLASTQKSMEERSEELQVKEQHLATINNSLKELSAQVDLKKDELRSIEKTHAEQLKVLELKEEKIVSLHRSVDKHLSEVEIKEARLEGHAKELDLKHEEIDVVRQAVEEQQKELEVKKGQLDDRFKELELNEKQIDAFRLEDEERRKQLDLRERQLAENLGSQIVIKRLNHPLPTAAADSHATSAQLLPVRDGSSLLLLLNQHLKNLDFIHKEVLTVIKTTSDPAKLVLDTMQGSYFPHLGEGNVEFGADIIQKSYILLLDQLIVNSIQIRPHVQQMAIELACQWKKKMTVRSENQLEILGFLHLLAAFRIAFIFNLDEVRSLLNRVTDQKKALKLQKHLGITETATGTLHVYDPAWTLEGILSIFQKAPNKAKFVLDVIEARLLKYLKEDQSHEEVFQVGALQIYSGLLEQLMQVSPLVQADVKKEALELAAEWKGKLRLDAKNSLEVLLFLEFVAAYGLASSLDRPLGSQLLQIIAQHKQAPAICRALGFVSIMTDAVQRLIAGRRCIEAVRIACCFQLTDKFSPTQLLEKHSNEIMKLAAQGCKGKNSPEVQYHAIDEAIASVSEIIQCIKDFKLEAEISSRVLEECIAELDRMKLRCKAATSSCAVGQHVNGWNNHPLATCTPMLEPQLHGPVNASASRDEHLRLVNKRLRTDKPLVVASYTPEIPPAVRQCMNSSTSQRLGASPRAFPARFGLSPNPSTQNVGRLSSSTSQAEPLPHLGSKP